PLPPANAWPTSASWPTASTACCPPTTPTSCRPCCWPAPPLPWTGRVAWSAGRRRRWPTRRGRADRGPPPPARPLAVSPGAGYLRTSADGGPGMSGHGEKLSRKQEQAIAALLEKPSLAEAAAAVSLNEKTLRRWLREDRGFQDAYRAARQELRERTVS